MANLARWLSHVNGLAPAQRTVRASRPAVPDYAHPLGLTSSFKRSQWAVSQALIARAIRCSARAAGWLRIGTNMIRESVPNEEAGAFRC